MDIFCEGVATFTGPRERLVHLNEALTLLHDGELVSVSQFDKPEDWLGHIFREDIGVSDIYLLKVDYAEERKKLCLTYYTYNNACIQDFETIASSLQLKLDLNYVIEATEIPKEKHFIIEGGTPTVRLWSKTKVSIVNGKAKSPHVRPMDLTSLAKSTESLAKASDTPIDIYQCLSFAADILRVTPEHDRYLFKFPVCYYLEVASRELLERCEEKPNLFAATEQRRVIIRRMEMLHKALQETLETAILDGRLLARDLQFSYSDLYALFELIRTVSAFDTVTDLAHVANISVPTPYWED